jgi:hypothetical protein
MEFNFEEFMKEGNVPSNHNIVKVSDYTREVRSFVQKMHEVLPFIKLEIIDLGNKNLVKPCEPFKDKLDNLRLMYQAISEADPKLYHWYIEDLKRYEQ